MEETENIAGDSGDHAYPENAEPRAEGRRCSRGIDVSRTCPVIFDFSKALL